MHESGDGTNGVGGGTNDGLGGGRVHGSGGGTNGVGAVSARSVLALAPPL